MARRKPPRKLKNVRWSKAIEEEICRRLAEGEFWNRISEEPDMPCYSQLYSQQRKDPAFAEKVAQARAMGADFVADRALEVAQATTAQTVSADRLKVSTMLKHAGLRAPQAWGGKAVKSEKGGEIRLAIRIRQFERMVGEDGQAYVREVFPGDEGYEP